MTPLIIVSILTRPEGRVQRPGMPGCRRAVPFVSILTRPEGRVQLEIPPPDHGVPFVSILTRPEGRVQPICAGMGMRFSLFQSSPDPKAGCNDMINIIELIVRGVSILTRPEGRVQR